MPTSYDELAAAVVAFTERFAPVAEDPSGQTRRRSRIMEVTLEIAAAEGVKGASLRRIAARTGMRTASLYSYFPGGKDELVSTALAVHLESFYRAVAAALDPDEEPRENVRRLVLAHTRWTLENPATAPAILVLERAHALRPLMTGATEAAVRELYDTYRDLLQRLLRASGTTGGDVERLAALLIVLADNVDAWALPAGVDEAQEDVWRAARRVLGWTGADRGGQRKADSPVRA